jgi:hypothetical protein
MKQLTATDVRFVLLTGLLLLLITMMGCSPTAYRANGCPYKEYNNKPFKA